MKRDHDWSEFRGVAIEPQRDLRRDMPGDDTEFAVCDDDEAELWVVMALREEEGDAELIADYESRFYAELRAVEVEARIRRARQRADLQSLLDMAEESISNLVEETNHQGDGDNLASCIGRALAAQELFTRVAEQNGLSYSPEALAGEIEQLLELDAELREEEGE